VDDDSVLLDPGCRTGSRLFFPSSIQQSAILWHDAVMPSVSFADDEVYGT
jgi:hypothetical protein